MEKSPLLKCVCCLQNIANLSEWEQSILYIMMKSKKRSYLYFTTLLPTVLEEIHKEVS